MWAAVFGHGQRDRLRPHEHRSRHVAERGYARPPLQGTGEGHTRVIDSSIMILIQSDRGEGSRPPRGDCYSGRARARSQGIASDMPVAPRRPMHAMRDQRRMARLSAFVQRPRAAIG